MASSILEALEYLNELIKAGQDVANACYWASKVTGVGYGELLSAWVHQP